MVVEGRSRGQHSEPERRWKGEQLVVVADPTVSLSKGIISASTTCWKSDCAPGDTQVIGDCVVYASCCRPMYAYPGPDNPAWGDQFKRMRGLFTVHLRIPTSDSCARLCHEANDRQKIPWLLLFLGDNGKLSLSLASVRSPNSTLSSTNAPSINAFIVGFTETDVHNSSSCPVTISSRTGDLKLDLHQ